MSTKPSKPLPLDVRDVTVDCATRKDVFLRVADLLGQDPEAIVRALELRECEESTRFDGVALPHAEVEGLDHAVMVDVRLENDVDWDGDETGPVKRCFCVLSPGQRVEGAGELLAEAARRVVGEEP